MKTLDNIVKQYLEMKTKYAIIITGAWGSGKTFYYQSTLKKMISTINVESDQTKTYKPISISLFGINSLEDIQSQILLELFPIAKNKKVKLGASVAKAFIKGIVEMNGLSKYYDIVADIEVDKKDWINFEELVIVFDDLERIGKSLEIEEVIGFINSLVETQNFKVIIIANEDKIKSKDYFKIKEKVIGNSIEFIPNMSDSFDGIITIFDSFTAYKSFLEANKSTILENFKSANLRILSFQLSFFHIIFSELMNDPDIKKALGRDFDKILLELYQFANAITTEYKVGKLSYKKRQGLENFINESKVRKLLRNSAEKEDKSYAKKFRDKYYPKEDYKFYHAIYDYITGGDILDFGKLKAELFNFYGIENNVPLPHYQIMRELNYWNCFNLTDKEYKGKTTAMVNYAKEGMYPISDYLGIFHYATRFSNPLKYNLTELKDAFIKAIKTYDFNYNPVLKSHLAISADAEHPKLLKEIREACIKKNDAKQYEKEKSEAGELEALLYSDLNEFYSTMFAKHHTEIILDKFDAERFSAYYLSSPNHVKNKISEFLRLRYHQNSDTLYEEQKFITDFCSNLEKYLQKKKTKSLSVYMIEDLQKVMKQLLEKMTKYR